MAVLRALAVITTILAMLQVAMAKTYIVGNPNGGWDLATNMKAWVTPMKFNTGDSLIFTYGSAHSVMEVTKSDYDTCTTTSPIQAFTGGNTIISLKTAGKQYFICGVPGHCDKGMKLEVDVSAPATTPPAPKFQSSAPTSEAPGTGPAPISETGIMEPPAETPAPSSATHSSRQIVNVAAGFAVGMVVVLAL